MSMLRNLPFAGDFPVSLRFGESADLFRKVSFKGVPLQGHPGIDFDLPKRTPVLAVQHGVVLDVRNDADGYGNSVLLSHRWGQTFYAHLDEVRVEKGQQAAAGQTLGLSGDSGLIDHPAMHFGMRLIPYSINDGWCGFTDPAPYLARLTQPRGAIIGPHIIGSIRPHLEVLSRWRPRMITLLDPSPDDLLALRDVCPDSTIVARVFVPDHEVNERINRDPVAAAHWAHEKIQSEMAYGVDYWQIANEVHQDHDGLPKLNEFELTRMKLADEAGYRCAIFGFSVGNPDLPENDRMAVWRHVYPALAHAEEHGHVVALHQYGMPDLWGPNNAYDWYIYRLEHQVLRRLPFRRLKFAVTEYGIDGLIRGNEPSGWQNFTTPEGYVEQLLKCGRYLERFSGQVLGYSIFTLGHYNPWQSYDIIGKAAAYLADLSEKGTWREIDAQVYDIVPRDTDHSVDVGPTIIANALPPEEDISPFTDSTTEPRLEQSVEGESKNLLEADSSRQTGNLWDDTPEDDNGADWVIYNQANPTEESFAQESFAQESFVVPEVESSSQRDKLPETERLPEIYPLADATPAVDGYEHTNNTTGNTTGIEQDTLEPVAQAAQSPEPQSLPDELNQEAQNDISTPTDQTDTVEVGMSPITKTVESEQQTTITDRWNDQFNALDSLGESKLGESKLGESKPQPTEAAQPTQEPVPTTSSAETGLSERILAAMSDSKTQSVEPIATPVNDQPTEEVATIEALNEGGDTGKSETGADNEGSEEETPVEPAPTGPLLEQRIALPFAAYNMSIKAINARPDSPLTGNSPLVTSPSDVNDVVYLVKDIFMTYYGSWEPSGEYESVPDWAREDYLRPTFLEAGADHHLFAAVIGLDGEMRKGHEIVFWSDGFDNLGDSSYTDYTRERTKDSSGWANLFMAGGSSFVPQRGDVGPWCWAPTGAAEVVVGGGLPVGHPVSTFVVWQAVRRVDWEATRKPIVEKPTEEKPPVDGGTPEPEPGEAETPTQPTPKVEQRISDWVKHYNLSVKPISQRPDKPKGDVIYVVKDFFTTLNGSWEPTNEAGSIPQWARDSYLKPYDAPDYFDDAGGDHHLFAAVIGLDGKLIRNHEIIYWSDGFDMLSNAEYEGYVRRYTKDKSGWANVITGPGSNFAPDRNESGPWCWTPAGASEVVSGGGMPLKRHISFFVVWQAVAVSEGEQPENGDNDGDDKEQGHGGVDIYLPTTPKQSDMAPAAHEPALPIDPLSLHMYRETAWNRLGLDLPVDSLMASYARKHKLGRPVTQEFTFNGHRLQGYNEAIVIMPLGQPQRISHFPW